MTTCLLPIICFIFERARITFSANANGLRAANDLLETMKVEGCAHFSTFWLSTAVHCEIHKKPYLGECPLCHLVSSHELPRISFECLQYLSLRKHRTTKLKAVECQQVINYCEVLNSHFHTNQMTYKRPAVILKQNLFPSSFLSSWIRFLIH